MVTLPTAPPPERLRFLARQVHSLGERALFELFRELAGGADLWPRVEAYAALAPYAELIDRLGGRWLKSPRLVPDEEAKR